MRKRRIFAICIISIIGIAALMIWKTEVIPKWARASAMRALVACEEGALGMAIVQDTDFLEERELQEAQGNPGVLFEGAPLPYDAESNTLYLPQSVGAPDWEGELSAKDFILCTTRDTYWQRKQEAIREGHVFWIWLVDSECYYRCKLVVSGTPFVSIDTGTGERIPDSEELQGTIRVFDPGVGDGRYEIHQSYAACRVKGNTSRKFDKKSYSLKLQDSRGQKVDAPLLGMRSDNSWKLNALYTDETRIREKTAAQIWEMFSGADKELKQDGPRLEYVELVVNNEYLGLYCLVEPVDEEKLGLDRNDVLYKVISWTVPTSEAFATAVAEENSTVEGIRISHPGEIVDYRAVWYPMLDFNERFYINPELDYEEALSTVRVGNLSDVFMFLMVASASDNHYKNLYFAAEVRAEGEYVMKQIPWDLDFTFGNIYDGESGNLARFEKDYRYVYADSVLPRLKFARFEEIGPPFLERWNQYRTGFLNTESILGLLRENRDYLVETGAMRRESERWAECPVTSDITELLEYQENRMEWLDAYFTEWATQ